MIVRLGRARVGRARIAEYERFERERSLPMFREHAGFVAVFFLSGADHCAALSVWKDMAAVDAPATSATHRETARSLQAAGPVGEQSVEVFSAPATSFPPEALAQVSKVG